MSERVARWSLKEDGSTHPNRQLFVMDCCYCCWPVINAAHSCPACDIMRMQPKLAYISVEVLATHVRVQELEALAHTRHPIAWHVHTSSKVAPFVHTTSGTPHTSSVALKEAIAKHTSFIPCANYRPQQLAPVASEDA